MVPMYVADEANIPSRRVAEKLGFELDSRWGYIG
jgi:RimJ/RimL family protein N-acetyltransferase